MNGIPVLGQVSVKATASVIMGQAASKLWALAGNAGAWGIYQAGQGDSAGSFAENFDAVVMSTKIGNTTIGDMIGGKKSAISPVVEIDSMISLENRKMAQVSDFRIEDGGFNSYNKVQTPDMVAVQIARGGDINKRKTFLEWLRENVGSTAVYDVVTPDHIYKNVTLEVYDISRTAEQGGASLVIANCVFRTIRSSATVVSASTTSAAQSANDAPISPTQRVSVTPATNNHKLSAAI